MNTTLKEISTKPIIVAQTSKSAVSRISQSAGFPMFSRPADLEVGDTAGWETCATSFAEISERVESVCCDGDATPLGLAFFGKPSVGSQTRQRWAE
ncbi:MAG TPA: hypothetical protein VGN23_02750 [Verrucomicrobiae bacterium]|jgi:hypothetical protein